MNLINIKLCYFYERYQDISNMFLDYCIKKQKIKNLTFLKMKEISQQVYF